LNPPTTIDAQLPAELESPVADRLRRAPTLQGFVQDGGSIDALTAILEGDG